MSGVPSTSYKKWLDPNSRKNQPRTTKYNSKKRKLETLKRAFQETEESNTTDSESYKSDEDDVNTSISSNYCNQNIVPQSKPRESLYNTENVFHCNVDNDGDWINAIIHSINMIDDNNKTSSDDSSDYDTAESEFRKKRLAEKKMQKNKIFLNERVHEAANASNGEIILMCMLLGVRHSLTWEALLDVMNLINKIFNKDIINLSKYKLLNFFPERKDWYSYHVYCPDCKYYMGNRSELSASITCVSCELKVNDISKAPYFLSLNIKNQFKELFENTTVQPHLNYRDHRRKGNIQNIEDVLDGDLYKKLSEPGEILSSKLNFSYIFNTDGCQATDSSPLAVWPVFLKINELPPEIRDNYIILAGLWVNQEKPTMNTFLIPLINELNALSTEGIDWKLDGKIINSKIIPLACCVDSVYRCSLLNMKQYNGIYGCTFCYHPTEKVEGTRKYPMNYNFYPRRTHEEIVKDMLNTFKEDEQTGEVKIQEIRGVKGASALINLKYFDLADGMTPDSMHSVFIGAISQYSEIVLSSGQECYYVGSPTDFAIIDQRLLSIKPPKYISRIPRSLKQRASWKASEWRSWLLYYCLPCLEGILSNKYFKHLSKFVCGIEILLRNSISDDDIKAANQLLIEFVLEFETLFGKEHMTYNIHLLLHIARSVKNLGPLHVHDAFCFENENRLLLHMKKSPTEVAVQIANRYFFYKSIPTFATHFPVGSRVIQFTEDFEHRVKSFLKIDTAVVIGSGIPDNFDEKEQELHFSGSCIRYHKLIYKKHRHTTCEYAQPLKINDSTIDLNSGEKGVISKICLISDGHEEEKIIIFYHPIEIINTRIFNLKTVKHIEQYSINFDKLSFCSPVDLKTQCILMNFNNKMYITSIVKGSVLY